MAYVLLALGDIIGGAVAIGECDLFDCNDLNIHRQSSAADSKLAIMANVAYACASQRNKFLISFD